MILLRSVLVVYSQWLFYLLDANNVSKCSTCFCPFFPRVSLVCAPYLGFKYTFFWVAILARYIQNRWQCTLFVVQSPIAELLTMLLVFLLTFLFTRVSFIRRLTFLVTCVVANKYFLTLLSEKSYKMVLQKIIINILNIY